MYPTNNVIVKPYAKIAKVGTILTALATAGEIIETWTSDNSNTFDEKLLKTGVQITSTIVGFGIGAATTSLAVACGFTVPATGGLSAGGVFVLYQ